MPRPPAFAASVAHVPVSPYSKLAHRLTQHPGEVYPLHVGDTWMEPPEGARMEDLTVAEHPGMHRYAEPHGIAKLLGVLVERLQARTGAATEPANLLLTTGATGGLGAVVGALVDPGDEVLLLAPYWPLISGIVRSFHATPVPVPVFAVADAPDSPESLIETVERHCTERTVALYLATPNNPSGRALPPSWVEALAEWARRHDLWLISDEVYEDYLFEGDHPYCRPLAPERTFSAHSFSKALGMAGNRCGYIVGPEAGMEAVRKVSVHTFYSAPTAGQLAGLAALDGPGDAWIARAKKIYREVGERSARRLGLPAPEGSTFLFLDVEKHLDERGLMGFLEDCVERGLFAAPGPSFGPYPHHVRICYTAAPPDLVDRGVEVLAELLRR